jgi:WD40 repeat protein
MNTAPLLQRRARFPIAEYPVDAAFSADGGVAIVAGGEGGLFRLNLRGDATSERVGEHAGGALAVAWQPAGALFASSGQDGEVRLWDSRTLQSRVIHAAAEWSEHLAFSGNGRLLAVANASRLHVFGSSGAEQAMIADHTGNIAALAWRPRLTEVAAACNGGVQLHRLGTSGDGAQVVTRAYEWKGACLTASWRPDGSVFASGLQDGTVHFWNIAAGTQSQMKGYGAKVAHTGWSANGKYLATAADRSIIVWEFAGRGPEGSEPIQLDGHTDRVTQMLCAPKGPYLASGGRDCRLLLWRPGFSGDPVDADLLGAEIALVRFSADGRTLLAADRAGQLTVYGMGSG